MRICSRVSIFIPLLMVIILNGCFDMSYRLTLNKDLSGKFQSQIDFSLDAWKAMENDTLTYSQDSLSHGIDTTKVKLVHYGKAMAENNIIIDWDFTFIDITDLAEVHDKIQGGELRLLQADSLMVLTFTIDPPEIEDPEDAEAAAMLFEGYSCYFDVELPGEIVEVNDKGTVLKDITMASWEFPLDDWARGESIQAVVKFKP